jgi:hypothetical protein
MLSPWRVSTRSSLSVVRRCCAHDQNSTDVDTLMSLCERGKGSRRIELSCNSLEADVLLSNEAVPSSLVDGLEFVSEVHHLLAHPDRMLEDSAVAQGVRGEGGGMGEGLLGPTRSAGREAALLEPQPAGQGMRVLPARPRTQHLLLPGLLRLVHAQGVGTVQQYVDCLLFCKPLGLLPAEHLIKYKRRPIIIIANK